LRCYTQIVMSLAVLGNDASLLAGGNL